MLNLGLENLHYNTHYDSLPVIISSLGIQSMVEVGVLDGRLINAVMRNCSKIQAYYAIDPWAVLPDRLERSQLKQVDWDKYYLRTFEVAAHFHQVSLIRDTSLNASKRFDANVFDLIYIDADHSFDSVIQDIVSWWPKVRIGGYLGGHDFGSRLHPGVRKAVETATELSGLKIHYATPLHKWGYVWIVQKSR